MILFPGGTPAWLALLVSYTPFFLVAIVVSLPIAWLFSRRGFRYGRSFLVVLLIGPLLSLALYLLLPVLYPPDGKVGARAKAEGSRLLSGASSTPKL